MTRKWPNLLWLFRGNIEISCLSFFKSSGAGLRSYLTVDRAWCWKGRCQISMQGGVWAADMNWPDLSIVSVIRTPLGFTERHVFLCKTGGICVSSVAELFFSCSTFLHFAWMQMSSIVSKLITTEAWLPLVVVQTTESSLLCCSEVKHKLSITIFSILGIQKSLQPFNLWKIHNSEALNWAEESDIWWKVSNFTNSPWPKYNYADVIPFFWHYKQNLTDSFERENSN